MKRGCRSAVLRSHRWRGLRGCAGWRLRRRPAGSTPTAVAKQGPPKKEAAWQESAGLLVPHRQSWVLTHCGQQQQGLAQPPSCLPPGIVSALRRLPSPEGQCTCRCPDTRQQAQHMQAALVSAHGHQGAFCAAPPLHTPGGHTSGCRAPGCPRMQQPLQHRRPMRPDCHTCDAPAHPRPPLPPASRGVPGATPPD